MDDPYNPEWFGTGCMMRRFDELPPEQREAMRIRDERVGGKMDRQALIRANGSAPETTEK